MMKITIDTQVDTYEDIQKVLHILTNILAQKGLSPSPVSPPADTTDLMSMFGEDSSAVQKAVPDTPPNFSSFLNLVNSKGNPSPKPEERPRVEFY